MMLLLLAITAGLAAADYQGFEVGTLSGGRIGPTVVRNGVENEGWDPSPYTAFSTSAVTTQTFYAFVDGVPAVDFTVSDPMADSKHNYAECVPRWVTPTVGLKAEALPTDGTKPPPLTISFGCTGSGQSQLQFTITPDGQTKKQFTIHWTVTQGTAISVATTAGGAFDVSAEGANKPAYDKFYDKGNGAFLAGPYDASVFFFVGIDPARKDRPVAADGTYRQHFTDPAQHAQADCKKHDDPTLEGCEARLTTVVPDDGSDLTSLMDDNVKYVDNSPKRLALQLVYSCKTNGQVDVTVKIRTAPFQDVVFKFSKQCEYTPGFSIATVEAGARSGNPDVVGNGEVKPAYSGINTTGFIDAYNVPQPNNKRTFWIFLDPNTAEKGTKMTMSKPVITSSNETICPGAFDPSGNPSDHVFDPSNPGNPIPMTIDYTACNQNVGYGGIVTYNITMVLGGYKRVSIVWRKANGAAPGLDIECGAGCPGSFPVPATDPKDNNKVVINGNAQTSWTQPTTSTGDYPVIATDIFRTEFPIAAILDKYPLQVTDFLFNTADIKSQCANEQSPATLKYRDIVAGAPTTWALDYWCRPMNNERVPLEVTLVLKNFRPVTFRFMKEVSWHADVSIGKHSVADVNSMGTYTSNWGPDISGSKYREAGNGKDVTGTQSTYFKVNYRPNAVSAKPIMVKMPIVKGGADPSSAISHNATDPADPSKSVCAPTYKCMTSTGKDCSDTFFGGADTNATTVAPNAYLTIHVTYNCKTTTSVFPIIFTAALQVSDEDKKYTPMQWRWAKYTSPTPPGQPGGYTVKAESERAELSWTVPDNGGVALSHYDLNVTSYKTGDFDLEPTGETLVFTNLTTFKKGSMASKEGDDMTLVHTGLKNNVKYMFTLRAVNVADKLGDVAQTDATPAPVIWWIILLAIVGCVLLLLLVRVVVKRRAAAKAAAAADATYSALPDESGLGGKGAAGGYYPPAAANPSVVGGQGYSAQAAPAPAPTPAPAPARGPAPGQAGPADFASQAARLEALAGNPR